MHVARIMNASVVKTPGLYRFRMKAALTQEELADRAGLKRLTIWRLENGGDARPPTVRRLAETLGCTPDDLYGEDPQTQKSAPNPGEPE